MGQVLERLPLFVRGGEYPLDRDQARPDEDRSRRDRQPPWKFASAIDPEDVIAAFADVYEPSGEDPELGLSEREFRRIRLSHRDERRNDDESLLADRVRNPRGFELSDDAVALLRDFLPITRLARAYHPRQDPLNTNVFDPSRGWIGYKRYFNRRDVHPGAGPSARHSISRISLSKTSFCLIF